MNVLFVAYSYIAALVGAGFASGQEILSFFVVHGKWGAAAIAVASLIFGLYAYFIIDTCRNIPGNSYDSFINSLYKEKTAKLVYLITFIFTCAVYCVMIACIGEMTILLFNKPALTGQLILSIFCAVTLLCGSDFTLKFNGVLGMFITIAIISCTIYILRFREHQVFANQIKAVVSGGAYAGYNMLGSAVVLAGLSKTIKSRREAALVGIISSAAIFFMMLLIWALLSLYYKYINLGEIPMLTMALRQNKTITHIYSIVLLTAVATTAVSSAFSICHMTKGLFDVKKTVILIFLGGMCLSRFGFSSLINTVYRLCGYMGIIIFVQTFWSKIQKSKKNSENER